MNLTYYILILVICIIIYMLFNSNKEYFTSGFYGAQCHSCNDKNIGRCMKCNNCGIYYDLNEKSYKCVSGDKDGPSDPNINTNYWLHNDQFSRYVYENKWFIERPYK
jgi:hypothetical protein